MHFEEEIYCRNAFVEEKYLDNINICRLLFLLKNICRRKIFVEEKYSWKKNMYRQIFDKKICTTIFTQRLQSMIFCSKTHCPAKITFFNPNALKWDFSYFSPKLSQNEIFHPKRHFFTHNEIIHPKWPKIFQIRFLFHYWTPNLLENEISQRTICNPTWQCHNCNFKVLNEFMWRETTD